MSKVSEKEEISYPLRGNDVIYIIRDGESFRGTLKGLFRGILKFVAGYEGYRIFPGENNVNDDIVQAGDVLKGIGAYYNGRYVHIRALVDNPSEDADFELLYQSETQTI